ncbi:MAG: serine protease [Thermoplasmata archaeon]
MFRFKVDEKQGIPVIVTCRHVVEGATRGRFKLHLATKGEERTPSSESRLVELDDFARRWVPHPNSKVDLCAMPLAPLLVEAERKGLSPFMVQLDENLLPSTEELEQLQAVENVLMVGYPTGLWDEVNNFPLFRRGITASHPAFDYQGESITVVDMACFPGSSGSPVLLFDQGAYATKGGLTIGSRAKLLGVLFQGPILSAEGRIVIKDIPTAQRATSLTEVMVHLGFIVRARELIPLGNVLKALAAGAQ